MKKVLVIDDDFQQRDLYHQVFSDNGLSVASAKDGLEGLEMLLKEKFDLVFTGIILPGLDGFGLVEKMRQDPKLARIPVVIFSHRGRDEDRAKATELGLSFMVNGYDTPKDIVANVLTLLGGAESTPPSSTEFVQPPAVTPPPVVDDDRPGSQMV